MATKDVPVNDPMLDPVTGEFAVIAPGHTFKSVTEEISRIVLTTHTPLGWFAGFAIAGGFVLMLMVALTWLFIMVEVSITVISVVKLITIGTMMLD